MGIQDRQGFLLLHLGQKFQFFLVLLGGITKDSPLHRFPALGQNSLAFGSENLPGTLHLYRGFRIAARLSHGGQQAGRNQPKDVGLTCGQRRKVSFCHAPGGQDCMMVADLFAVDDLFCVDGNFAGYSKVGSGLANQIRQARLHILGQIPAVGARVGYQLLFIEGLGVRRDVRS